VLKNLIPININSVPIKTLIQFRESHESERRKFYDGIASLAKDMDKVRDHRELEDIVHIHEKSVQTNLENLERRLRNINITCAIGAFAVSPPSYVTAKWGLDSTNPYVLAGTGALVLGGALVKSTLDRKAARAESPWAYMLSIRERFKARSTAREILRLNLNVLPDYIEGPIHKTIQGIKFY
jgi:hypothetical protein